MIQKQIKKIPTLLSGALICTVIMLVVYKLKGVWPFGMGNVTYDDMAQGTLPIYYHLYDWLHGDKAMAFDWYTGLGTNIVNSGTFMPLDLVLCLFSRDKLLYGIGVLIIVKVAASAVTAKYVFDKLFANVAQTWRILFTVIYAMSGYSMFYYTNSFWLDFVVIFPLVIYGLKRLLADNKPFAFILFFAYTLYLSVYIGFMVTLSVFLLSGLYILLLCEKEKQGHRTCLLGISTLTAVLLSAWHSVPMAIQTLSSQRLGTSFEEAENSPLIEILKTDPFNYSASKLMLNVGLQIAFVLTAIFIIRLIKDKKLKQAIFVSGSVFILFAPILFENINLIWHGGSYMQFTMRYFFVCVFVIVLFALASIDTYSETLRIPKKRSAKSLIYIFIVLLTLVFIAGIYFFAAKTQGKLSEDGTLNLVRLIGFYTLFGSGIPLFALLLCQKKLITKVFCFMFCIIQTFGICYAGIANEHRQKHDELFYNSPDYIEYCREVSSFNLESGALGRIKNSDTSLNTNYPFILGVSALSNWTHNIPEYMQQAASSLGYSTQYTRILDSGGTAFTDGLLGIEKLIVRNHIEVDNQYKMLDSTENFVLYENSYAFETGLLADKDILTDTTTADASERFDIQNKLYSSFTGSDNELFSVCSNKGKTAERIKLLYTEEAVTSFSYTAGKNEVLYINTADFKDRALIVAVNGKSIIAPYYKETNYSFYPTDSVNGIFSLGSFNEGQNVIVTLRTTDNIPINKETIQLAYMSLDKIATLGNMYTDTVTEISRDKTSLTINYNNTHGNGKYMFIPVTYDSGWECTINGEEATVHNALGSYIAIELPEGSGTFTLKHTTPGLKVGIILSIVGLVSLGFMLLIRKREYALPKPITSAVKWLFILLFAVSVICIYVIPIIFFAINMIDILKNGIPSEVEQTNG